MENLPLVSVIIPVYKVENYLDRCVNSVVSQTYPRLEIILVDDGSPDNCPQLCDKWVKKDKRIKVIHKSNDGLANARNSGIEICTGDYVMFADSDDYLDVDMVEFLVKLAVENNADVARCGFYCNTEADSKETASTSGSEVLILDDNARMKDLLLGGHVSGVAWNKLYTSALIKTHLYDKADGCSEDIMHNFRVYRDVQRTAFCDVPKYHYVIRENSITNSVFNEGAFDIIRAKKRIIESSNSQILPFAIASYIKSGFIVISGCIQNNAFEEEKMELIHSITKYKAEVLFSKHYSFSEKVRVMLLSISPKLYSIIIQRAHK